MLAAHNDGVEHTKRTGILSGLAYGIPESYTVLSQLAIATKAVVLKFGEIPAVSCSKHSEKKFRDEIYSPTRDARRPMAVS